MMKYLVVSDSHGDRDILVELFRKYHGTVDYFFHCGDSELPANDKLWQRFITVKGNCDYADYKNEQVIDTGMDTIYMTHGHLSNVKINMNTMKYAAESVDANIAFFGHTHVLGCERESGILFLNPGSIRLPRIYPAIKTYAIITSDEAGLDVKYYNEKHEEQEQFANYFKK